MTITQREMAHKSDQRILKIIGFYVHGTTNRQNISLENKSAADVPKIAAPPMILYAGLDGRINGGWQDDTAPREANGNEFGVHFFPIVNHRGHNAMPPRNDGEAPLRPLRHISPDAFSRLF